MTNVGVVKVQFDGDASKAEAAFDRMRKALSNTSTATEKYKAALGKMEQASEGAERATERTASAAERAATALSRGTSAALDGTRGRIEAMRKAADGLDSSAGKLQTAIGGVSQALGVAAGRFGDVVGGVADMAMAFASGGPLLLGLTAATVAIAAIAKTMMEAKEAEGVWRQSLASTTSSIQSSMTTSLAPMRDAVRAITDEVKNFGKTSHQVALEAALMQHDQMQRQIENLEKNKRHRQAMLNAAESRLQSATAKGRGVEAAQEEFDLQRGLADAEAARTEALTAALPEVESAILTLSAGIVELNRLAAAGAFKDTPVTPAAPTETPFERGIASERAMLESGNYGRSLFEPEPERIASDYNPADAARFEREMARAHSLSLEESTKATTGLTDILDRAGEGIARGALSGDPASIGAALGSAAGIPMAGAIVAVLADAIGGLTAGFTRVADRIISGSRGGAALSDAGGVMKSAMPLMGVGGIVLLPAFFLSALLAASTHTERFGQFAAVAGKGLDLLVNPLGYIWQILMPLAGGLVTFAQAVQPITTTIISLMPLETVGETLFLAFGSLATVALYTASGLGILQRETLKVAEGLIPGDQFADQIAAADAMADAMWTAAEKIGSTSWEDAQRAATGVLTELGDGIAATFPDDQQNLPSGYRIPFYESETPNGPGGGGGAPMAPSQTQIGAINNLTLTGPITVSASTTQGLTDALMREAQRSRGRPWLNPPSSKAPRKN